MNPNYNNNMNAFSGDGRRDNYGHHHQNYNNNSNNRNFRSDNQQDGGEGQPQPPYRGRGGNNQYGRGRGRGINFNHHNNFHNHNFNNNNYNNNNYNNNNFNTSNFNNNTNPVGFRKPQPRSLQNRRDDAQATDGGRTIVADFTRADGNGGNNILQLLEQIQRGGNPAEALNQYTARLQEGGDQLGGGGLGQSMEGTPASPAGIAAAEAQAMADTRAPPPPREPDPAMQEQFRVQYADQDDEENVAEHLKEQKRSSAHGASGTIDTDRCYELIQQNDVVFIVTDTGTGKSTLVPKKVLEKMEGANIVSAQPRRTATINLAERVAKMTETKPGEKVGYSVRGEHCGELGETPLMYVTNYTLFLYLLWRDPAKIPFTHVFLDEIHERTPEVELMLLLLKLVLRKYPKKFKIILCSATTCVEEYREFFDKGTGLGEYNQANVMFPVHNYYAEDIAKLVGCAYNPPAVRQDNVVESLQLQHLMYMVKQTLEYLARVAAPQHSILVFLPGRTLVEHLTKWVKENLDSQLDPIAWYRDVDLSFIQSALERESSTKKKVYIATDIAEVSLTLPDVVFVIDSGTCKRPIISEHNAYSIGFPPLQLLWEGPNNCRQRRGRTGRVQQGFYFLMLSKAHHDDLVTVDNPIANAVLNELVLHSLQLTASPFAAFGLCREKPRSVSVRHSLHTLRDGGFILPLTDKLAAAEVVKFKQGETPETEASKAWNALLSEALQECKKDAPEAEHKKEAEAHVDPAAPAGATDPDAIQKYLAGLEYQVTMKGLIVSHAPTAIEAGSTIFYSLLFGMPTLGIYLAAVEATRSPFYVPYNLTDREKKKQYGESVSNKMRQYHGEFKSDVICCLGAILEYLDMQRDGLSEEAQEQWCEERFLSRTRLVDTVHLVQQIKEQVKAVIPFPDVEDIDVLRAQFERSVSLLNLLSVAAHVQWAVAVRHDGAYAQRKGYIGSGVFIDMRCLKDTFVPTVCPWTYNTVCVPLTLTATYNKLLCTFATQVSSGIFNLLLIVFACTAMYEEAEDKFFFRVCYMGTTHAFVTDRMTGLQLLQLRRMQCARLCVMQLQVEQRVTPEDTAAFVQHLSEMDTDFGIPEEFQQRPDLLPNLLQSGLATLLQRITTGEVEYSAMMAEHQRRVRQRARDAPRIEPPPPPASYCWVTDRREPPLPSAMQSLLVHSSNGIAPLDKDTFATLFTMSAPPAHHHGPKPAPPAVVEEAGDSEEEHDPLRLQFD